MKRVRDTAKYWKEIHFMELALYVDTLTQDYDIWRKQRVNSQQISSTNCTIQNHFSEETPSEMARQEFEREKAKMSRDLSALQEENYQLKIEVQVERSGTEKYEIVTAKLANSQSEHQELKRKTRDLENMLQSRQQQLDNLLKALEEKSEQYDRDIHAYEGTLKEKEMQLDFLINEIRKAAMQVVQLSDEAEVLSCQFPPSQRSSISEFLEQVKKQGNVARKFV
ncbi:hypothetical protein V6Z11_A13G184700 [Gossypium hirsutum]